MPSDPHTRFDSLAGYYAQARPSYPAALIDFVCQAAHLGDGRGEIADIGCGTGISTRLFAERSSTYRVIGIEPNGDMLQEARQKALPNTLYQKGAGEATGLEDASQDLVISAQAFHWLDAPRALREFERILKPGGMVALFWYELDMTDVETSRYGQITKSSPDAQTIVPMRQAAGLALERSGIFADCAVERFYDVQILSPDDLIARGMSVSYKPKDPPGLELYISRLQELARSKGPDQSYRLAYEYTCYYGYKN
jgi:SAM-dependent methyltransferase